MPRRRSRAALPATENLLPNKFNVFYNGFCRQDAGSMLGKGQAGRLTYFNWPAS